MEKVKGYVVDRLAERDTRVVILAAIYSIGRAFVPPEYHIIVDGIASALGLRYAATPSNR